MVSVLLLLLLFVIYKTTPLLKPFLLKLPRLVWPGADDKKDKNDKRNNRDKKDKKGEDDDIDLDEVKDDESLESMEFKSSGILDSQGSFSEGTMNSEVMSSVPDDEMSLFKE